MNYLATGLTAGVIYEFKVKSRNQFDYSEFSETVTLLCAYIPDTPTNVVTEIFGSQVKVSWDLPTDNGSPILDYRVYILESGTGVYT